MTDQFDNFQLDPNVIGSDWVFSGDQVHANRAPGTKISNSNYYFAGARMSQDRTKTVFDFKNEENPERTIGAGFAGWGVDWSLFNYNPYGGRGDGLNSNFKVKNDWLQITGMGNIDVKTRDVMDKKDVDPAGMSAYRNYPTEGFNSFGKKGDKRWSWQGNSWVPGN